jgi:protein-arginine kinase activator protein McsA
MNNLLQYVNSTMKEINSLSDELYESLIDKDFEETKEICDKLSKLLKDVRKGCLSEF